MSDDTMEKIGTERFNYEMQRHEILLGNGWQPTLEYDHQTGIYRRTHQAIVEKRMEADLMIAAPEIRLSSNLASNPLVEENARLRAQLWLPTEPGQHDYIGPTKKDPETGERTPIPDQVHEQFHGSIGHVLSGKIIPEARRQMQEALKNAPKEKAPIPTSVPLDDPKRMGWRL